MADQFAKVISNGRLFTAFLNANERFKLGQELDFKVNKLYDEYLQDPTDEGKSANLEAVELEVGEAMDYRQQVGTQRS